MLLYQNVLYRCSKGKMGPIADNVVLVVFDAQDSDRVDFCDIIHICRADAVRIMLANGQSGVILGNQFVPFWPEKRSAG